MNFIPNYHGKLNEFQDKNDRTRDLEEHREQGREFRERKWDALSNIERENQSQLEVEAGM